MGLIDKLAGYLYKKGKASDQFTNLSKEIFYPQYGVPDLDDLSYSRLAEDAWAKNTPFHMVINRLSLLSAQLDRSVIENEEPTENEQITTLENNPNPTVSGTEFRKSLEQMYRTYGEVYIFGVKPIGSSQFAEFWTPTPQDVSVKVDLLGKPESYDITIFSTAFPSVSPENVLHIKQSDIRQDYEYGFSSLQSARYVFQANNALVESEYHLHKNKGAAGVLFGKGNTPMLPSFRKALQRQYDTETTGSRFAGVRVSDSEVGYVKMGMNPADLKSIESYVRHLRIACALFGAPSQLYGDTAASTYNNMNEAKRAQYEDAVLPTSKIIDNAISKWLLEEGQSYLVDVSKIEALQDVNMALVERYQREIEMGTLTVEEARDLLHPELTNNG